MASLKGLLTNRNPRDDPREFRDWLYPCLVCGTNYTNFCNGVCWKAPRAGTAHIEIWGAGGPGARMCCCGDGLPRQRRWICLQKNYCRSRRYINRMYGYAAKRHHLVRLRNQSTGICWVTQNNGNGCMCARGGYGGKSACTTGSSLYCCYRAQGSYCKM